MQNETMLTITAIVVSHLKARRRESEGGSTATKNQFIGSYALTHAQIGLIGISQRNTDCGQSRNKSNIGHEKKTIIVIHKTTFQSTWRECCVCLCSITMMERLFTHLVVNKQSFWIFSHHLAGRNLLKICMLNTKGVREKKTQHYWTRIWASPRNHDKQEKKNTLSIVFLEQLNERTKKTQTN